jgi:hypothetical protein
MINKRITQHPVLTIEPKEDISFSTQEMLASNAIEYLNYHEV